MALVRPAEPSWEELAASAVAGEAVARRDLARRILSRVRRFAVLMGAREEELERVVLAILEEAFGTLATCTAEPPFVTWLDRIAARALLRAEGRWRRLARAPSSATAGPIEEATRRLALLEPERRLAVILAVAGGAAEEDVAAVLGGAPSAVRARLERARRELAGDDADGGRDVEQIAESADDALLDALTERRIERAAIAALERAPAAAAVPQARPRRWAWAALGAAAAAMAALLAAAVLWPGNARTPAPRLDAAVALASGEPTIAGTRARAGRWVGSGAVFAVPADGRLGLALGDGTLVLLSGGARGHVEAWTLEDARIRLEAGTLVARVARRQGRTLAVTAAGLTVRGERTIFALAADAPATVRVLRGLATAERRGGRELQVHAGQELRAGGDAPRASDPGEVAADWALAGRHAVAAHGARIAIETTPAGASVALDGEPLGRTPLSLLARPGATTLSVSLAEHAPVREELDLHTGDVLSRRFTLVPLVLRATRAE